MWSRRLPTLARQINPVRYMSIASAQHVSGKKPTIGFIGLGHMGGHMAHNLMKAGYPLIVYDIAPAAINTITARATALSKTLPHISVRAVATPRHVAEECPIVITMLPSSPHVRSTYTSIDGILKASTAMNKLLIDSSTIDPGTAREVAGLAAAAGSIMVDAPVSGGVGGAEAGTLTFMVGGPTAAYEQAKPYLQLMGKNIVHCGDAGTGQVAKVCNNLILGISMIAVSEGMNLGVKLGMDPAVLAGIINTSSGRCWSSDTYNPCPGVMPNVPASRGYTGGFGVDLMKKDMGLALMAAQQAGQKLPLGECSNSLYDAISQSGNGNKDFSYVYEYLRTLQQK